MRAVLTSGAVFVVALRLLVRRPLVRRDPSARVGDRPGPGHRRTHRSSRRAPTAVWSSSRDSAPPDDLSASVDLLAVAVSAGLGLAQAIAAVAATGEGPTARSLRRADAELTRGASMTEVLGTFGQRMGPAAQPIVASLVASVSSGEPAGPALRAIAQQERRRARRRVEARVRRLPALLAIPLTLLVLPAFVVTTLVPVGLTAAEDLRFPSTSPTRWSPP